MNENEVAAIVVDAALEVHKTLGGPGLLESVYEEALAYKLDLRHLDVQRQHVVPVVYKGKTLSNTLRLDLLVMKRLIVECKATASDNPLFEAQALTYLRMLDLKLALVINFGQRLLKNGIHRVVNGL